jgi:peptidyl-dipeptidase Dcp
MTGYNPLLEISNLPNKAPAFEKIKAEHYFPAIETAIAEARTNYDAIKNNAEAPTFENTILAMETSSEKLGTVAGIFYNQLSCMGGDDLHDLAEKIGPINANFSSDIILDEALFARVKAVYDDRASLTLTPEQATLLEDAYKDFARGGALLDDTKKQRLREISEALSTLSPSFMNNASKSAEAFELIIDNEADLAGLPDNAIEAAAHDAAEKGLTGKWRFTLDYPSYIPFVQYADNRDLRHTMWEGFSNRAYGDDYDNCDNVIKIVSLKDERAKLLGYDTSKTAWPKNPPQFWRSSKN